MRIRYIATFADTLRSDAPTLAREYLSARDATEHEFHTDEDRANYAAYIAALGRFLHSTRFPAEVAALDGSSTPDVTPDAATASFRPVLWSFGEGPTYSGYTNWTYWNGFLNVRVDEATWPYVLRELIAGADGDKELEAEYAEMSSESGLVDLSGRFTISEVETRWTKAFPEYPVATMPPIPSHWADVSWRNESAPSFQICTGPMGEVNQLWIDYQDRWSRDVPEAARFTFSRRDGEVITVLYEGEIYAEALERTAIETLACRFVEDLGRQLSAEEWREMRLRNRSVGESICASHDFLDANMVMLAAWKSCREPAFVGDGDADALMLDIDHVNAAWSVATTEYLTASDTGARFDDWRLTGRDVTSLAAEGIETGDSTSRDDPGRIYSVGYIEADGPGWLVVVSNTSESFETLFDAERHLWWNFASDELRQS